MPTYLHTNLHTYICTYIHTYKLLQTLRILQLNPTNPTLPYVPLTNNTLLPYKHYGVATISRLLKIIGLLCKNIVPLTGLFCKRDR